MLRYEISKNIMRRILEEYLTSVCKHNTLCFNFKFRISYSLKEIMSYFLFILKRHKLD